MRILIATCNRGFCGGVETYLAQLLPALRDRGHEVALLHEEDALPGQPTVDAGVKDLPCWRAGAGAVPREVVAWAPQVVYLHVLKSPASEAALVERFPTVLFAHAYYGTCVSGTKRVALPVLRPCDRVFGAGCLVRYLPCRCGGLNPLTMLSDYRRQADRRSLLGRFRAVLVASQHMRREYHRHGVAEERLHRVPLFPAGQACDPSPPPARPRTDRVLMLGRLTGTKGGRVLVHAVARAQGLLGRRLTLVVAGDGPERGRIEALARRLGVCAEFTGWVDAGRRTELMRGADVLAVPSVWPEPFGLVGIEAGCVGLPAVAFGVGGIPDWLVPGESGELAPKGRPTAAGLADALVRALQDPAHLARLGRGAWRKAREFTLDNHLARLEPLLKDAVCAELAAPHR
jgi:glycosyltransferase involved in cell wall biosynthesis